MLDIAVCAAEQLLSRRTQSAVSRKRDGSMVTSADFIVENWIRTQIFEHYPEDSVVGEELGAAGTGRRMWLVDPIDGTQEFVEGGSEWGTHLCLMVDGRPLIGVVTRPAADRLWWAVEQRGAWTASIHDLGNAVRLKHPFTESISEASVGLLVDSPGHFNSSLFASIEIGRPSIASYLDGQLNALIDIGGDAWDVAPLALLAQEMGGCFIDRNGGSRTDTGGALYTDPVLLEGLLSAVGEIFLNDT